MTWKNDLMMLWIFCTILITLAARHLFEGAVYLVEQMAAFSVAHIPGLLHLLSGRLR